MGILGKNENAKTFDIAFAVLKKIKAPQQESVNCVRISNKLSTRTFTPTS